MYTDRYRQTIKGLLDVIKSTIDAYVEETHRLVAEAEVLTCEGEYKESDMRLYAAQVLVDITSKINRETRDRIVGLLGDDAK